jgi:tetratricopeptide (TPR) repeat protein
MIKQCKLNDTKTAVSVVRESVEIPTYEVGDPEKNPMFFEKRVYQGSSGKVYPLPYIDRVFDEPVAKSYDSITLENDLIRLVLLPEIGGRIFKGQDKSNDDYDFFYRQDVIKPALVGLAGPWLSGGVEFNWPQHHRPGTFMPTDVHIENEDDGAVTVWMSEHDPITRMKGMHGIRLRPGSALIELRARLFNRTPITQTFLWWANVAARVNDDYQSFFPADVDYVADHAVRAQTSFPVADGHYYGVDYGSRAEGGDLSWYRNIPVPTSYMVCETDFSFFGGYDHGTQGGFIHVANRHISPGKKQWTWGNHEFGWAWDRELTDTNGPYVELMAGVYTDNQPDFAYLAPYETKTFSQFWWPYQQIGTVKNATTDAAIALDFADQKMIVGVAAPRNISNAQLVIKKNAEVVFDGSVSLAHSSPWQQTFDLAADEGSTERVSVELFEDEKCLADYTYERAPEPSVGRDVAVVPPDPEDVSTNETLYLIGEHLDQYRHPTRPAEEYWDAAIERDENDSRSNIAMGQQAFKKGCLAEAINYFKKAIARLTSLHPNPRTGEAHYFLGLAYQFSGKLDLAYQALYKSAWNFEWRSAAYYQLALIDCTRHDFATAIEHCNTSIETNTQNNKVYAIKSLAQRKLRLDDSATLSGLLERDSLDHLATFVAGDTQRFLSATRNDAQTILDVAYDLIEAGFLAEARDVLVLHHAESVPRSAVPNPLAQSQLTLYALGYVYKLMGMESESNEMLTKAREASPDYLFPSRLHDQLVLEWALKVDALDFNAAFGLGNYYYNHKRHDNAIEVWESVESVAKSNATIFRNLGIAYWNKRQDADGARRRYDQALELAPDDARIFFESDQLAKKLNDPVEQRLSRLLERPDLVALRDDCTVELVSLLIDCERTQEALKILLERRFHPWEGGEGQVLEQYKRARLTIGKSHLEEGEAAAALEQFELALKPPQNLGEAYHLLQAKADVSYWIGKALRSLGQEEQAKAEFSASANERQDFEGMAVTTHSEKSYFRGLALFELGQADDAIELFESLKEFAGSLTSQDTRIDYFATSLPLMLVFNIDLKQEAERRSETLQLLAEKGLNEVMAGQYRESN